MDKLITRYQMRKTPRSYVSRALPAFVTTAALLAVTHSGWAAPQTSTQQEGTRQDSASQSANAAAAERMLTDISEIASDKYEGRGPGTKGIDMAADYIAKRFAELGLKVDSYDGSPFQHFELPAGATLGETNEATLSGPGDAELALELGENFTPLSVGGSARFDMPLVFVGYGITAPDLEYDDYDGMDVRGKAVIILQGQPQTDNEEGPFSDRRPTEFAQDSTKISNAYQHGAEAVILVMDAEAIRSTKQRFARSQERALGQVTEANEEFQALENPTVEQIQAYRDEITLLTERAVQAAERTAAQDDPLVPFSSRRRGRGGEEESRNVPVMSIKRSVADKLLEAAGKPDLAASEAKISETLEPSSFEIADTKISGEVTVNREIYNVKNVVGVLPATVDGPLADQTIIIGAHYDHLGYGGRGSLAGSSSEIHNGADDNGSGTTGVMELARRFSQMKDRERRLVFILFTCEERGLIGSAYHANNPLFPLEDTVFMLNLDMIGRLRDNKLTARGTGTAAELDEIIDNLNEKHGFEMNKDPAGQGPSDHASFYRKDKPVIDFFTNTHDDYHRPTDDPDTVNVEGMARIVAISEDLILDIMAREEPLTFTSDAPAGGRGGRGNAGRGGAGRGGRGNAGRGGRGNGDGTQTDDNVTTSDSRPWFGAIPSFGGQVEGVQLNGTSKGSPAEKAGLKEGDIIVELGGNRIGTLEDLNGALYKFKIGDKVRVVAMRGEEELVLEVELDVRPDDIGR